MFYNFHDPGCAASQARWDPQYAFLMEQSSADWVLRQKPCDLDSVPTGVRTGQYAMAVQNQDALRYGTVYRFIWSECFIDKINPNTGAHTRLPPVCCSAGIAFFVVVA